MSKPERRAFNTTGRYRDGGEVVEDLNSGEKVVAKFERKPWRQTRRTDNRRTDYWFRHDGRNWWGFSDEGRTVFSARVVK